MFKSSLPKSILRRDVSESEQSGLEPTRSDQCYWATAQHGCGSTMGHNDVTRASLKFYQNFVGDVPKQTPPWRYLCLRR
ncbi:hypothetical protein RRG08_039968 [Elysia crispata]|uniref:Uncharacterized protein n=1 Tax=Elysia crispata TaxID=231223 RepID=A0AAE1DBI3_9GAST|nr:hypothetical protein RRG08_039968 [Elysia crispata]